MEYRLGYLRRLSLTVQRLLFTLLLLLGLSTQAQIDKTQRKTYQIQRTSEKPKIDGQPFEAVWENVPAASDWYQLDPNNGEPEFEGFSSQVKLLYDDQAIYLAAYLYDDQADQILRQFSQRDQTDVQADKFTFAINTYDDQVNETLFEATSAGSFGDVRVSNGREDRQFNVVFISRTSIDDEGWYVEMEIPYGALRFPETEVQDWGINFFRDSRHRNVSYSWNYVDITEGSISQYTGQLEGLRDIDPPTRLFFYPFVQSLHEWNSADDGTRFSAGLDLKYGINDAFTLDLTLIPDFGQVAFDNVSLNLGPFEQTFDENREFFIEGTELFNKADIFFSRRIGDGPLGFGDAQEALLEGEIITENPELASLVNAIKVTGRTEGQLGVGILNAITEETNAILLDTVNGTSRRFVTEPLTNYNVLVLDQIYGDRSSVNITNTNVIRSGAGQDANVTSLQIDHYNDANTYRFRAQGIGSVVRRPGDQILGYKHELNVAKVAGQFRWDVGNFLATPTYEINDLGRNFRNNFNSTFAGISYETFTAGEVFQKLRVRLRGSHRRRYDPDLFTGNGGRLDSFFVLNDRTAFGVELNFDGRRKDIFEPRVDGLFITYEPRMQYQGFISTDYRNRFAVDLRASFANRWGDNEENLNLNISPRFRVSDKFLIVARVNYNQTIDRISYVTRDGDDAFFSQRYDKGVNTSLSTAYNFDPFKSVRLNFRNSWGVARFKEDYRILQSDGTLGEDIVDLNSDFDRNFNVWNLDLSYNWRFAPGSEAVLLYRQSLLDASNNDMDGFGTSLGNLFDQRIRQVVSLRINYFLDYNKAKGWFSKNS